MIETEQLKSYTFTKSPSYLVLIIISINMFFWLAYIFILIIEESFDAFGSGTFANLWYDVLLLIGLIIFQQVIHLVLIWRRYTESYIVSKNQIKHKRWIFVKEKQEYSLKNIISVKINKSFRGNILNYWDIKIVYSILPLWSEDRNEVTIKNVSNPEYLISLIKE